MFMSNQLGNLGIMEDYFWQMHDWLIQSNSYANTTYLKRYIQSMLGILPTSIKKYFEDKHLSLSGMTLAMVHDNIKKVIEEHCLAKCVMTDFKEYNKIFSNNVCTIVFQMPNWGKGPLNRDPKCYFKSKHPHKKCWSSVSNF